jgi:nitric oxide reductase NorE protein
VPGEVGIWIFILGDLTVFGVFFCAFMYSRGKHQALFEASRRHLTVGFAVTNTILLLTSSLLVAMAVRAARTGSRRWAPPLITGAIGCALGFVASKIIEYSEKLHHHITPTTNLFYTYYFVFTGIHLLHLLLGIGALLVLRHITRRTESKPSDTLILEVGASYWHMVDVLWILLFPVLYLVR